MRRIKVRVPYRKLALDKGRCTLDESRAFSVWLREVERIAWERHPWSAAEVDNKRDNASHESAA